MCLTNATKITPQEDIECYKVFKVNRKELDSDLLSPRQDKKWRLGRTEMLRRIEPIRYVNQLHQYTVEGGAYHSYQTLNDVYADYFDNPGYVVCKCIIPKDSKYVYSGLNNRDEESKGYASQKLKPIEFVHVDGSYLFERFMLKYSATFEPVKK